MKRYYWCKKAQVEKKKIHEEVRGALTLQRVNHLGGVNKDLTSADFAENSYVF